MIKQRDGGRFWLWFEYAMAFAVLLLIARSIWFLFDNGYLPQPFFYDPSDTYMDWFNTAYWAYDPGTYDNWNTIYPPLSFVIARVLSNGSCYPDTWGQAARACDWGGLIILHLIFVLNIILTAMTFIKIDRRTAIPRAIAVSAGMPMLFTLERGNILILCFTAAILGFGPLLKSARARWIFVGVAINLKVYLLGMVLAQLLRRRWLWVEGAMLSTVLIYAVSYAILGRGTPFELFNNVFSYSTGYVAVQVTDLWYPATFQPLISLLEGIAFPVSSLVGTRPAEIGLVLLPAVTRTAQLSILLAAGATWLRPEVVPVHRTALLGLSMALVTSDAGGYTQIMLLLLVFMEPWRGIARPIAIITAYVIALPGDILVGWIPPMVMESFLFGGRRTEVNWQVGLGMFFRPSFIIIIAVSLSALTIYDVWKDIKAQGWKNRWRYRRDWPILPGVKRPERPYPETSAQS